jgi:hypothetical protein
MRISIIILTLLFLGHFSNAQKIEKVVEYNFHIDSLNNRTVKAFEYDSLGNLTKESLTGFKPLGSKYRSTGTWIYKYENSQISNKLLINRPDADTISMTYDYSGSKVRIKRDELITESKIKDGLVYGDGTENGCIVPPEALEFYKIWVKREDRKIFYKNEKKQKEHVYFSYKTNPYNLIYEYSDDGILIKLDQINRNTGMSNWTERYIHNADTVVRTREYFITYWGKIPPKEIETTYFNSDGQPIRTIIKNSKDGEDGVITSEYQKGLLISQEWQDLEGTKIRKLEYRYE